MTANEFIARYRIMSSTGRYRPLCARCGRQVDTLTVERIDNNFGISRASQSWIATAECHGQEDVRPIDAELAHQIVANTLMMRAAPMAFDGAVDAIIRCWMRQETWPTD